MYINISSLEFEKKKIYFKVKKAWKGYFDPDKKWLSTYYKKDFQENRHQEINFKWINSFVGYGVFAKKEVPYKAYIGEYVGVVCRRKWRMIRSNPYCVEYPVGFDTIWTYVIDAKKKGNFTRFINHSSFPNVELRSALFEDGVIHMILIAKKKIYPDEELSLDYGKRYWRQMLGKKKCHS